MHNGQNKVFESNCVAIQKLFVCTAFDIELFCWCNRFNTSNAICRSNRPPNTTCE